MCRSSNGNFHNTFFFAIGDILMVTSLTSIYVYKLFIVEKYKNRVQFYRKETPLVSRRIVM